MALSDSLYLYLRLERLMMDLDDRGNPLADRIRDLMDPLWYSLSDDDHKFLDSRGAVEVRVLYPVTLVVPDLFSETSEEETLYEQIMPEDGVGTEHPDLRYCGGLPLPARAAWIDCGRGLADAHHHWRGS